MAKGDAKRVQTTIDTQGNQAQNLANNLRTQMLVPTSQNAFNNLQNAVGQQMGDYNNLMSGYQNMLAPGGGLGGYSRPGEMNEAFGSYRDFMNTGGFTPQGLADIRARDISPTRAVYQNAQSNIDRQRALQGGYSPNYTAATAKMSRDLASGLSDANTNANAGIAQMVQQGKLAGTQGMGSLSAQDAALALQGQQIGNQARLGALGGAANLYGTHPGLISEFGNQLNQANQNWLGSQGQQNQLGLGLMGAQTARAYIPSTAQNVLGNIQQGANIAGSVLTGIPSGGGGGQGPSTSQRKDYYNQGIATPWGF